MAFLPQHLHKAASKKGAATQAPAAKPLVACSDCTKTETGATDSDMSGAIDEETLVDVDHLAAKLVAPCTSPSGTKATTRGAKVGGSFCQQSMQQKWHSVRCPVWLHVAVISQHKGSSEQESLPVLTHTLL